MCRFLLIKSKKPIKPKVFLRDFAVMCKNNTDWQGDGWGMAWRVKSSDWEQQKSLKPIWEDVDKFDAYPETNIFAVHARGASFPHQKGEVTYNQPYTTDDLCFVFNGEISKVRILAEGKIGAQKIFNILKNFLRHSSPSDALKRVQKLLRRNSQSLLGINIGVVIGSALYVLCDYDSRPEYYTVRYTKEPNITIVCSEEIGEYNWRLMGKGEVLSL